LNAKGLAPSHRISELHVAYRVAPTTFEPCNPTAADRPPSAPGWLHEIKHDGFRLVVRRDAAGARLDHPQRPRSDGPYPMVAAAVAFSPTGPA
jgi:hypothetical protein